MAMPPSADPNLPSQDPDLAKLDTLAKLLDNQFRLPGTQFRFGVDALIGLIPYVGDMAGFLVSGVLMRTMWRKGASPWMMMRMMFNFVIDALVGAIPILGDLFDFGYKANRRNVDMLKQYYADGSAKPNAKRSLVVLGGLFLVVFAGVIWMIWNLVAWLVNAIMAMF